MLNVFHNIIIIHYNYIFHNLLFILSLLIFIYLLVLASLILVNRWNRRSCSIVVRNRSGPSSWLTTQINGLKNRSPTRFSWAKIAACSQGSSGRIVDNPVRRLYDIIIIIIRVCMVLDNTFFWKGILKPLYNCLSWVFHISGKLW